jgi:hypothetical protein
MACSNWRMVSSLALALPAAPSFGQGSPTAHLEKLWETSLRPAGSRPRAGVCPDGTVLATDGEGRLVGVESSGRIAFDARFGELGPVWAIACDGERALLAAADSLQVHVLDRRKGQAPLFRVSHAVPLPAHAVALDEGGAYWILTVGGPEARIHRIGPAGAVQHSFPAEGATHLSPMLWDTGKRRLVVFSPSTYEARVFSEMGQLLETKASFDRDFHGGGSGPGDRVKAAVSLPDGRSIVLVSKMKEVRPNTYVNPNYLDLLGPDLRMESTGISINKGGPFGRILGADEEGNLYFLGITTDALHVVKAKLQR